MSDTNAKASTPEFDNHYFTIDQAIASVGKTADGVTITQGLAVITNEMEVGVVDLSRVTPHNPAWFDVVYASGGRVMQDGDRVATVFRGLNGRRVAADEWAAVAD